MRQTGLTLRVRSQKVKIGTFLPVIVGCILFLTTGCTATYEFTIPDGHPAKTDTYEAVYEPSQTLLKTDPIDTQPARSEYWDDEDMKKPQGALKFNSPFRFFRF